MEEEQSVKIRLANMNVYEAERNRLVYEHLKGRSNLTAEQLDDAIDEINARENEARYPFLHVVTNNMDSDLSINNLMNEFIR